MEIEGLISELQKIDTLGNQYWIDSLNERKRKELEFHDRDRDKSHIEEASKSNDTYEKFYGNKKYYRTVRLSTNYVDRWLEENAKGKVFLDYACGNGLNAIKAAKLGAKLAIGLDISSVSIRNAREAAKKEGVESNTYFIQADAENTRLPNDIIDSVICQGMLHHLDLSHAFYELRRVLVPGGKILAVEALDYNPLIKLYRLLTPAMRTEWEKAHILSLKDVRFAKRFFDIGEVKYWHIVSYAAGKFPSLLPLLESIDKVLCKIPLVKYMAWIFTFELIKPRKN